MTKIRILDDEDIRSGDDGVQKNLPGEADYVYKLLERLDTSDKEELAKAEIEVDEYLKSKQRKEDEEALKRQVEQEAQGHASTSGSKKGKSRTVINTRESETEKRRRLRYDDKKYASEIEGTGIVAWNLCSFTASPPRT